MPQEAAATAAFGSWHRPAGQAFAPGLRAQAAGGVTPSAADLAAHCTAEASTPAMSAEDIASGYTKGFTCTDAELKAVEGARSDDTPA